MRPETGLGSSQARRQNGLDFPERSKEEEEDPPPEGGGAAVHLFACSLPSVATQSAAMFGGKLPPGAGGPRNGRGPQHLVQVGEVVPGPRGSGLAGEAATSEPSEAESSAGAEDQGRRIEAAPSQAGDPENQPAPAADVVSAGEPGDRTPDLTGAATAEEASPQAPTESPKPRFFERSTPNQLWQTDIFTFRLGGKNAYLIGFLDDYSRYVVGLEVFRSQTAEHVLEVYRRAVAEYGVPKEMLSDQGRQYSSWRGTTRFEAELRKDRVHHLKSGPHHPTTLCKIERFWKTIWEEFLERAQFDSFESTCERVRLWVKHYKHYNHRRPHQSLEGLCPADRFFALPRTCAKSSSAAGKRTCWNWPYEGSRAVPSTW